MNEPHSSFIRILIEYSLSRIASIWECCARSRFRRRSFMLPSTTRGYFRLSFKYKALVLWPSMDTQAHRTSLQPQATGEPLVNLWTCFLYVSLTCTGAYTDPGAARHSCFLPCREWCRCQRHSPVRRQRRSKYLSMLSSSLAVSHALSLGWAVIRPSLC